MNEIFATGFEKTASLKNVGRAAKKAGEFALYHPVGRVGTTATALYGGLEAKRRLMGDKKKKGLEKKAFTPVEAAVAVGGTALAAHGAHSAYKGYKKRKRQAKELKSLRRFKRTHGKQKANI